MSDREFVNAWYERKLRTLDVYFKNSTQAVKNSVIERYKGEWANLLKPLDKAE